MFSCLALVRSSRHSIHLFAGHGSEVQTQHHLICLSMSQLSCFGGGDENVKWVESSYGSAHEVEEDAEKLLRCGAIWNIACNEGPAFV